MLYGHVETVAQRIDHLDRLRTLQDETGGFDAFIPLKFRRAGNRLGEGLEEVPVTEDMRTLAMSRIYLDNFPHIKAYWVMISPKLAQVALSFGADDMDGTVKEEVITHMAGAETEQAIGHKTLIRLIREAGREPVQRDTLYNVMATF